MKYRSRTEIIAAILTATSGGGSTKTRLMYSAFLSYAQMQGYVEFLQEHGLIVHEELNQKYKLTEKGLHFLHVYEKIGELISPTTTAAKSETQFAAAALVREE